MHQIQQARNERVARADGAPFFDDVLAELIRQHDSDSDEQQRPAESRRIFAQGTNCLKTRGGCATASGVFMARKGAQRNLGVFSIRGIRRPFFNVLDHRIKLYFSMRLREKRGLFDRSPRLHEPRATVGSHQRNRADAAQGSPGRRYAAAPPCLLLSRAISSMAARQRSQKVG
jgi:hypothetical protein